MEGLVPVGVPVVKELVLQIVQKDVVDAIIFVKLNAMVIVLLVPVVSVASTLATDHVDWRVVIRAHALMAAIHPHVLASVCNLVMRRVHM